MIIDAHTHYGVIMNFYMPKEMLLESLDKYNIDYALVSNSEASECDHDGTLLPPSVCKSQMEAFADAIEFGRKHEKKIGILPWIRPRLEGVDEAFEAMVKDNLDIVKGIKVHPHHSNLPFDHPRVQAYIELGEKYNLPIVTHTGNRAADAPLLVYKMAEKYPKVNFIMAHMGLGTDNQEAIQYISKLPNLYGDTTWVPMESTLALIKLCGSEKIMFGSDNPIDGLDTYYQNPKGEPSLYQQYFHKLPDLISKEEYENIMFRTAAKVFHLPIHSNIDKK